MSWQTRLEINQHADTHFRTSDLRLGLKLVSKTNSVKELPKMFDCCQAMTTSSSLFIPLCCLSIQKLIKLHLYSQKICSTVCLTVQKRAAIVVRPVAPKRPQPPIPAAQPRRQPKLALATSDQPQLNSLKKTTLTVFRSS